MSASSKSATECGLYKAIRLLAGIRGDRRSLSVALNMSARWLNRKQHQAYGQRRGCEKRDGDVTRDGHGRELRLVISMTISYAARWAKARSSLGGILKQ